MKAVYYHSPRNFDIREVPIPQVGDDEVLFKVVCCGICGTDGHVHEGEFISSFPLIPGHEVVGVIADWGKNVTGFAKGDRVVADPGVTASEVRGDVMIVELTSVFGSASRVSTAAGGSHYFVRTSKGRASAPESLAGSANT